MFGVWVGSDRVLDRVKEQFPDRFHYHITTMGLSFAKGHWQVCEHHIKLLVVDEKYFVVGGTNLWDSFCRSKVEDADIFYFHPVKLIAPRACFDMDVCCTGPLAKQMRHLFFDLWNLHTERDKRRVFPTLLSLRGR